MPEKNQPPEPTDPDAPTQIDGAAAFRQGQDATQIDPTGWNPPKPEDLNPLFADYEITALLGRGGMGAVYKAIQVNLDREVAIKLLPPEMAAVDPTFAERFQREAKAMAKLDHPNIVTVFDFGVTSMGHSYFVMEFVDGMDFHQLIHSGQLDPAGALNAVSQICDALEYAHEQGYVHRDIKPANIFINQKGILKVGDFGLAKIAGSANSEAAAGLPTLTIAGSAMGTPFYSAPEQLDGGDVDHRADIYSLGVMFYEMLTKEIPRGRVSPPSEKMENGDKRLDELVFRAMESEPGARYANVSEMRTEVDWVRTHAPAQPDTAEPEVAAEGQRASDPGERAHRLRVMLFSGALVLIVAAGTIWFMARQAEDPDLVEMNSTVNIGESELTSSSSVGEKSSSKATKPSDAIQGRPFENDLGMRFVPVPIVGGPTDGQRVLFNIWETRVKDYEAFVNATNHAWPRPEYPQDENHPAARTSWDDANAFCDWLTKKDRMSGLLGPNERYRLPTDHEWSCAADIGAQEDGLASPSAKNAQPPSESYHWGKQWPPPSGVGNYYGEETRANPAYEGENTPIAGFNDGFDRTAPVGSFAANQFGLYDLGGNLWEWCEDWYDTEQERRVLRGASWNNSDFNSLHFSKRRQIKPGAHTLDYGFRVVLDLLPDKSGPSRPPIAVTPALASKAAPFENSFGMRFVPVPISGGTTDGERVLFSIWETRVSDFEAFMQTNSGREWLAPEFKQDKDHPAVRIQWQDAIDFCDWLTKEERRNGNLGPNERYRLPRDHEWSCAAGIGELEDPNALPSEKSDGMPNLYIWGREWPPPSGVGNLYGEETVDNPEILKTGPKAPIAGFRDPFDRTAPVGSFAANEFGLFDICGNVAEWCLDRYSEEENRVVVRGNAWSGLAKWLQQIAHRSASAPTLRFASIGFRVVLETDTASFLPEATSDPTSATKERPFENNLGMRFVPVPITGGPSDGGRVLFSIWETRVKDYEPFAKAENHEWPRTDFPQELDHPAVNVKFASALAFCKWLTEEERRKGKIGKNESYRLPTDHEWSCAVGIGAEEDAEMTPSGKSDQITNIHPWGTGWPPPRGSGNFLGEETSSNRYGGRKPLEGVIDGFDRTAPVGTFRPNSIGLHDLAGNASEWCEDWRETRILRGGSFTDGGRGALCSSRRSNPADSFADFRGFRVVLVSPEDVATSTNTISELVTRPDLAVKTKPFENSLGMRFVPVSITGGITDGERILFSIWKTRVRDYEAFMRTQSDRNWLATDFPQGAEHPAVRMSWFGAMAFCEWLTQQGREGGLVQDDEHFRLPTDHEWSCAAGIGRIEDPKEDPTRKLLGLQGRFSWGSRWPPPPNTGNFAGEEIRQNPWKDFGEAKYWIPGYKDPFERTAPVGSFTPNELGLYDLIGNGYEWVLDSESSNETRRTSRGASWGDFSKGRLKSSHRVFNDPGIQFDSRGFRCVLAKVNRDILDAVGIVPDQETSADSLTPVRVTHNGQSYLCWRGSHVEFQLTTTNPTWTAEKMTQLVTDFDAIHQTAKELTGIDLSGPQSERVIIREGPNMPENLFVPINAEGVLTISTRMVEWRIGDSVKSGAMPSWLIDRSLERLFETLNPALGFPAGRLCHKSGKFFRAFWERLP